MNITFAQTVHNAVASLRHSRRNVFVVLFIGLEWGFFTP